MKTETVKKLIKKRFGSMTKFAIKAKIDRYELQKFFAAADKNYTPAREERARELFELAKTIDNAPGDDELTPEVREALAARIEELGGVSQFCEDNPEFNKVSVWHILNGTRKTMNETVRKLIEAANQPTA